MFTKMNGFVIIFFLTTAILFNPNSTGCTKLCTTVVRKASMSVGAMTYKILFLTLFFLYLK